METEKEMTAIQKTQVYLENYREIERYIKDAISEVSQIDDVSRYNISAEKAFLQSIRECKAENFTKLGQPDFRALRYDGNGTWLRCVLRTGSRLSCQRKRYIY